MIELKPQTKIWREKVLSAFFPETGAYSNVIPRVYSNFIDMQAWVAPMLATAIMVNDRELADVCTACLSKQLQLGLDVRNFSDHQVNEKWEKSKNIEGYYVLRKPQAFAGPSGLAFALQNGASIMGARILSDKAIAKARWLVWISFLFGQYTNKKYLLFGDKVRWTPAKWEAIRQHINSEFMAFLITGRKVPKSMNWLTKNNAFYAAIAGIEMPIETAGPLTRVSGGHNVEEEMIVPLCNRYPSSWVWKQWPYARYVRAGQPVKEYTPTALLVGAYFQAAKFNKDIA